MMVVNGKLYIKNPRFYVFVIVTTLFYLSLISKHGNESEDSVKSVQDVISLESLFEEVENLQGVRRSSIRRVCSDYFGQGILTPSNPFYASKFWPASLTLAEEEGIAWCRVGKVGTTAWSALFLLLRSVPLESIKTAVKNLEAHDLLKQNYPSKPGERMHKVKGEHGGEYFSFMVVRHPFVRLVSAYRDKLETLDDYNVRYHVKDAVRMTDRRTFNSSVADNPSFPEFVDYLIRTPPNLMDKHWAPYSKVCLPCNLTYNAVLKLETLEKDSSWLFNKLNLTKYKDDWDTLAGVHRVHGGPGGQGGQSSEQLALIYFEKISKVQIRRLYDKFEIDFLMFDYDKQVEEYIAAGF